MKTIQISPSIEISVHNVKDLITFQTFITIAIDQYEKLAKGASNIRLAAKIIDKIEQSSGKENLSLEDTEYDAVKEAIEGAKWNPAVSRKLLPFFDAVESAK